MGNAADLAGKACAVLGVIGLVVLLSASPQATAEDNSPCPEPTTWQRDRFTVDFERERQLDGFAMPLRSTGQVIVEHETLWWRTEAPIASTLRIDQQGLWQTIGDGELRPLSGSAGGGGPIATLMLALLNGDLEAAEADFSVEQGQDQVTREWAISLVPRAAPLANLIERIHLSGCDSLRTVVIEQASGDLDSMVFGEPE